jgi:hypothetical protein
VTRAVLVCALAVAACGSPDACPSRAALQPGLFDCTGFPAKCHATSPAGGTLACGCDSASRIGFCCAEDGPRTCDHLADGSPCCASRTPRACDGGGETICECDGVPGNWFCRPLTFPTADALDCALLLPCVDDCLGVPSCIAQCEHHATAGAVDREQALVSCQAAACGGDGHDATLPCESALTEHDCQFCIEATRAMPSPTSWCRDRPECGRCADRLLACRSDPF